MVVALLVDDWAPSFDLGELSASGALRSDSGSSNGVGFEVCAPRPSTPLTIGDACTDKLYGLDVAEGIVLTETGVRAILWERLVTDC